MDFLTSKKVDFLIRYMGPIAEMLDVHSCKLTGNPLQASLMEVEVQKFKDRPRRDRKESEKENQDKRSTRPPQRQNTESPLIEKEKYMSGYA